MKKKNDYIEIRIKHIDNAFYDGTLYKVYMILCGGEYVATVRYEEHKEMILKELLKSNSSLKVVVTEDERK